MVIFHKMEQLTKCPFAEFEGKMLYDVLIRNSSWLGVSVCFLFVCCSVIIVVYVCGMMVKFLSLLFCEVQCYTPLAL